MTMAEKGNILVIDDAPTNLRLLVELLNDQGYKVLPAPSGKHGLAVAQSRPIDIILLDIMMPGMDGYKVCRRLKAQKATRDIPVLFLSALNDAFDKVKAFDVGGVDYIIKPFQAEEVVARVELHLSLCRMQQALQLQNEQLQEREIQLHQEIAERRRVEAELRKANTTKDTFLSIMAHDLRSPFSALLGFADLGVTSFKTLEREEIKNLFVHMKTASESVYALLGNLLTWSRVQRGLMNCQPRPLALRALIDESFSLFHAHAKNKQIEMHQKIPDALKIYADKNMICTAVRNLISNALKFTHSGGKVEITASRHDQTVEILVSDTGIGISEERIPLLFSIDEKISTAGTAGESGTGLGLPLCKDLIEQNKGTIRADSIPGRGATFIMTLPCPQMAHYVSEDKLTAETAPSSPKKTECYFNEFSDPPQISLTSAAGKEALAAGLSKLPLIWRENLHHAAEIIDLQTAEEVVEQIRSQDSLLAERVTILMQEFRYDILLEVLENINA